MQEQAIPCRYCGASHTFHEDCVERDEPEHERDEEGGRDE